MRSEKRPDHNFIKLASASATPSMSPSIIGPDANSVARSNGINGITMSEARSLKKLTNPSTITVLGIRARSLGGAGMMEVTTSSGLSRSGSSFYARTNNVLRATGARRLRLRSMKFSGNVPNDRSQQVRQSRKFVLWATVVVSQVYKIYRWRKK